MLFEYEDVDANEELTLPVIGPIVNKLDPDIIVTLPDIETGLINNPL
jgi:hypothetical protein